VELLEVPFPAEVARAIGGVGAAGDLPSAQVLAAGGEAEGFRGLGLQAEHPGGEPFGVELFAWVFPALDELTIRILAVRGVEGLDGGLEAGRGGRGHGVGRGKREGGNRWVFLEWEGRGGGRGFGKAWKRHGAGDGHEEQSSCPYRRSPLRRGSRKRASLLRAFAVIGLGFSAESRPGSDSGGMNSDDAGTRREEAGTTPGLFTCCACAEAAAPPATASRVIGDPGPASPPPTHRFQGSSGIRPSHASHPPRWVIRGSGHGSTECRFCF
jgi:hypothetical protein